MAAMRFERGRVFRVTLFCPGCGSAVVRWQKRIEPGRPESIWLIAEDRQPRGRPQDTASWYPEPFDGHYSWKCGGRTRHGTRCDRSFSITDERLMRAIDSARRAGNHDLVIDVDF